MVSRPKVKICCISSIDEAMLAIECGADVLGFVSEMPSGPGVIDDGLINEINKSVPAGISTFLLTSETSAEAIIAQHKKVNTTSIQIVDKLEQGSYEEIRTTLPGIEIVQVVHVNGKESIEEAIHVSKFVDYILLDSGNAKLQVKELGGTGRTHNWEISKEIRKAVNKPIFLAGGLKSTNIQKAVNQVQPYGVDLCSSVRTDDKLDALKLKEFFKSINQNINTGNSASNLDKRE